MGEFKTLFIIVTDKPSSINKQLLKFINTELANVLRTQHKFAIEIANDKSRGKFESQGISTFPVMIIGSERVTGNEDIAARIKKVITDFKAELDTMSDDIMGHLTSESLRNVSTKGGHFTTQDEEENEDDLKANIARKADMYAKRRASRSQSAPGAPESKSFASLSGSAPPVPPARQNNVAEAPLTESVKDYLKSAPKSEDDDLLRMFYENSTESV